MTTLALSSKVILSNPSEMPKLDETDPNHPVSWIQVSKTGKFQSTRYGKFEIARNDHGDMLRNFTRGGYRGRLPVDYDHIGMSPQRPGDGKAAGWFRELELRNEGDELWGLVEWTPDAAEMIRKKEYKFISPSFVKDHTNQQGEKVGTQLLAAAVTNFPFLPQMAAVTLYSFSALGDLALEASESKTGSHEAPVLLAESEPSGDTPGGTVGQVVMVSDHTPDAPAGLDRSVPYAVTDTRRDDEFKRLMTAEGLDIGWLPSTSLQPADAPKEVGSPMPKKTKPVEQPVPASVKLHEAALSLSTTAGIPYRDAVVRVGREQPTLVLAHRHEIRIEEADTPAETVVHLAQAGEDFETLVGRIARERKLSTRDAISLCAQAEPALASCYEEGL